MHRLARYGVYFVVGVMLLVWLSALRWLKKFSRIREARFVSPNSNAIGTSDLLRSKTQPGADGAKPETKDTP